MVMVKVKKSEQEGFHVKLCAESNAAIKVMDNCNRDFILTSFSVVTRWWLPDLVNDAQFLNDLKLVLAMYVPTRSHF